MEKIKGLILDCPETHLSRVSKYLMKNFKIKSEISNHYIFVSCNNLKLVKKIQKSLISRIISRMYLWSFKTKNFEDIYSLNFKNKIIRIQASPMEFQEELVKKLDQKCKLNPKIFTHILYALQNYDEFFYGLFNRDSYFKRPDEINKTSRAYFKIKEAIEENDIKLNSKQIVLDIGSAPGGWLEYLSPKVKKIYAVDPAELEFKSEKVIHIKKRIEQAYEELKSQKFDMFLCDINQDPIETINYLKNLFELLKPNHYFIMTIKLVTKDKFDQEEKIEETIKHLKKDFKKIAIQWLIANSNQERTLIAQKR